MKNWFLKLFGKQTTIENGVITKPSVPVTPFNDTTMETSKKNQTDLLPAELDYLERLINYRLDNPSGTDLPFLPPIDEWALPVKDFLIENAWQENQDIATLILIALAPHVAPHLFDVSIQDRLKISGDFPEIGGVRGKNFRGFLPTGQTAIYLLAGNYLPRRKKIEQLFWPTSGLTQKRIIWLEDLPAGEPIMSGKIVMANDYIELFLFGLFAPPHFSATFPAKRITTELSSRDIVMSEDIKQHYKNLREWIQYNTELTSGWDKQKRLKKGFRVLFYGPPGTGKTLTANVLGNETGKEVYKIDLSMVISKYIGETEKNLEFLFARAEDKDWILFFDEADSIFGKRTGVRDAHDKYANQEVSYLLQRIEDFNGLVILATNMKSNIDDAFIRRFNDIVKFSIPTESERKEIWEKSFPSGSDYADIPGLVKKYDLSGGNISNVIQYAGIQAVKRSYIQKPKPVLVHEEAVTEETGKLKFYLEDVLEGIKREMIKEGKSFIQ